MARATHEFSQELRLRNIALESFARYSATAHPEVELRREIDQAASTRSNLWGWLARFGPDATTSEEIRVLNRKLDFLYEELRITRMVAA